MVHRQLEWAVPILSVVEMVPNHILQYPTCLREDFF